MLVSLIYVVPTYLEMLASVLSCCDVQHRLHHHGDGYRNHVACVSVHGWFRLLARRLHTERYITRETALDMIIINILSVA